MTGINFTIPKNYKKIVTNPKDPNSFVIVKTDGLLFCEIKPKYVGIDENSTDKEYQIVSTKFNVQNDGEEVEDVEYLDFVYDIDSRKRAFFTTDESQVYLLSLPEMTAEGNYCESPAQHLLLTQKHLIISKDKDGSCIFDWYLLENEEAQPLFEYDKSFSIELNERNKRTPITTFIYNHNFENILMSTSNASIYILPIKAESLELEEEAGDQKEEEEGEAKSEEDEFANVEINKVNSYHTGPVAFVKELAGSPCIVTGGHDGKIQIWNVAEQRLLASLQTESSITAGDVDPDGHVLFIGSAMGVIKIFDVSNRENIKLIDFKKIFMKPITKLQFNQTGDVVAVTSSSRKLFFLHGKHEMEFNIIGFAKVPEKIFDFTWSYSSKLPKITSAVVLVADNALLMAIPPPPLNTGLDHAVLDQEICPQFARRIDPDSNVIAVNDVTNEVYISGKDKLLKKYKLPEDYLDKLDKKIKAAPIPIEEVFGHPLVTRTMVVSKDGRILFTGGKDGTVFAREAINITKFTEIKAHSLSANGVSLITVSKYLPVIYTGSDDGSVIMWAYEDFDFEEVNYGQPKQPTEAFLNVEILEDHNDEDLMHYKKVLEDEYNNRNADARADVQAQFKSELEGIKRKLNEILITNQYADDLEKLDRDEFVLNVEGMNRMLAERDQKKQELLAKAERDNAKQKILYNKVKKATWDKMKQPLKHVIGLQRPVIVYNFQIRERTASELKNYQAVMRLRKMELREKIQREENKILEILNVEEFIKKPENFLINGKPGPAKMVLVDYEAKEDAGPGETGKKEGGRKEMANVRGGKPAPVKGKPADAKKQGADDKKDEEDAEKKKEEEAKRKRDFEESPEWNDIYSSFELFTNNRKKSQKIILRELLFKIKEKFNKEFESLVLLRTQQVDLIQEKNNRIKEILTELGEDVNLFEPPKNVGENPEEVLTVHESDVGFERYLSKEKREELEKKRLAEEERLRLLSADDAGRRAVLQMMNGTLEEKKETALGETLEREEWMNKPKDQMNEDELMKLREFELKLEKLNEEKEKIKNNLRMDLRKLRNDINDICNKFDEKLFVLFRRRLEFEYRICEQELYMINLALSIEKSENKAQQVMVLDEKYEKLRHRALELRAQREMISYELKRAQSAKNESETLFNAAHTKLDRNFSETILGIYRDIFEDKGNDKKKNAFLENAEFQGMIQKLDPYITYEENDARKIRDEDFENFLPDVQNRLRPEVIELHEAQRAKIIEILQHKHAYKREMDHWDKESKEVANYLKTLEQECQTAEEELNKVRNDRDEAIAKTHENLSNIEVLIRFKQGQVEFPQEKPIPDTYLEDAILINKRLIDRKNKEIREKGDLKIEEMKKMQKTEFEYQKGKFDLSMLELDIEDLTHKKDEISQLRVTRELQMALMRKEDDPNGEELQKLSKQIELLDKTTTTRIKNYQEKEAKIKRDIEYLQKENAQLLNQGLVLKNTVNQRSDIMQMMKPKNEENKIPGAKDDATESEAYKKFKEISTNKRLFEMAKRQTEEIELLREELTRLKSKTFANFSNVA